MDWSGCFLSFNPHTRMGGERPYLIMSMKEGFIPQPAWGRLWNHAKKKPRSKFQSTHPHGVRRTVGSVELPRRFQSTHRMGWDVIPYINAKRFSFNQHPAWGARKLGNSEGI
jgi:hypothetical protein